jgi:DNA-binding NtrC family response regulator
MVDDSVTSSPAWPQLRVGLARANRFFINVLANGDTGSIAAAMRDGAYDVLAESDGDQRWIEALTRASQDQRVWFDLYGGHLDADSARLIGRSQSMINLRHDIQRLGATDVSVLVIGESGVGKERVAAALHTAGAAGPYVTLNCAAMPKDLLEAELFGSEKGAFTGSLKTRIGLVEQANGGTLFLDEIGELDLSLQPKLLRFLETRRARRVGGDSEYAVKVRIIAATNRDLELEVDSGRFRGDLYFRLAEVVMRPPPLRERLEDIPDLARAFLSAAGERFGKNIETIEPGLIRRFQSYYWPGNIRELKSVVDRLVLFHDGPMLREGWWDPPVTPIPRYAESGLPDNRAAFGISSSGIAMNPGSRIGGVPHIHQPLPPEPIAPPQATHGNGLEWRLPGKSDRLTLAKQLLSESQLSLTEVAARTGVHPTTLFRWRKSGKV